MAARNEIDEKGNGHSVVPMLNEHCRDAASSVVLTPASKPPIVKAMMRFNARIEGLAGFEARGITRVLPEERQPASTANDLQVFLLWLSINTSIVNIGVGLIGPTVLHLGFLDSTFCAVFGGLFGSLSTAYMSTWGSRSGNRTMVVCRYFMGYWPSKIPCFLNIILMIGYGTIDAIVGGQVLSAVSGGSMTVVVGIVIVCAACWVVAVFGMALFQKYERFAWLPQVLVLFILIGCAGPYFDLTTKSSSSGTVLIAERLTFFSICSYAPNSWSAAASDFYVYYPERTSRVKIFLLTLCGLWTAFTFVVLIAIGLATGITSNPAWAAANDISTGALIVAGYNPLGGFGSFCSTIVALGAIANSIPGTYSAALGCQTLGHYGQAMPRWVWSCILILIQVILALAGREYLVFIYQNFVSLMGYWIEFMVCIFLEEQLIFRWNKPPHDWTRWQDTVYLPVGLAALASFLLGWLGAVLGMSQAWYVGPLAKLASHGDVGMWVGVGLTALTFPPLRYIEIKVIGR